MPTVGKDILPHFTAPELRNHNRLPGGDSGRREPREREDFPRADVHPRRPRRGFAGQPGGPDKAAESKGFMRLLLLNRQGRGGLGGVRRAGNGVEKLSPGFVHGLHIAVIFILELPTKFALEMTSESLITAQPGDFLATRCSR